VLVCAQILGFAGVLTVIGLTASSDDWNLALMAGVLAFAVISDLSHVDIGSSRIKVSGSFLGIVLAAVLMGGGPAAVLGVLTIAIGWFGSREPWHYLRNNLLTFAWASLLAGLFFHWVTTASGTGPEDALYYVFAFATFGVGLAVDYVMVAGYQCYLDRVWARSGSRRSRSSSACSSTSSASCSPRRSAARRSAASPSPTS
jgi:uncharacterized membrane protein